MDLLYQKTRPTIPIYDAHVLWFKRLHGNNKTVHNDLNERIVEQLRRDMPLLVRRSATATGFVLPRCVAGDAEAVRWFGLKVIA